MKSSTITKLDQHDICIALGLLGTLALFWITVGRNLKALLALSPTSWILFVAVEFVVYQLLSIGKRPKGAPPGPPTWPVVGNMLQLFGKQLFPEYARFLLTRHCCAPPSPSSSTYLLTAQLLTHM